MAKGHFPLTERLKDRLTPDELRDVQSVERTATAKFVHAESNGVIRRFWGIAKEVWILVAFVWFVSQKWNAVETKVEDSASDIASIQQTLSGVSSDVQAIKAEHARMRDEIDEQSVAAGTRRRTVPQFAPEWSR